jgi:hypothetical protein
VPIGMHRHGAREHRRSRTAHAEPPDMPDMPDMPDKMLCHVKRAWIFNHWDHSAGKPSIHNTYTGQDIDKKLLTQTRSKAV